MEEATLGNYLTEEDCERLNPLLDIYLSQLHAAEDLQEVDQLIYEDPEEPNKYLTVEEYNRLPGILERRAKYIKALTLDYESDIFMEDLKSFLKRVTN